MTIKQWIYDTLDRMISSGIQAAILFFIAAQKMDTGNIKPLISAVFVAVATVLLNAFPQLTYKGQNFWVDIGVRIARTFGTVVIGAAVADGFDIFQFETWQIALFAGGSAVLVIIKGELAKRLKPDTITPASFAPKVAA